jgi:ABC-2 type transport system permease protein
MASLALLTPHAWAIEGFRELVFDEAGFVDILRQLGVLLLYAVGLVAVGTWGLRRSLTRG